MRCKLSNGMKSVFIVFQLFLITAYAAQPEIGKQYTLENAFLKEAKVLSLDTQNKLYMEPVNATNAKQKWTFSQGPNGSFYMHNVALGQTKAVDSDANRPDIRNKGNYTGQYWQFTQVGDWLLISNKSQGLSRVLDTYNATGNYLFFDNKTNRTSGKFWKLKALASNATTSTPVTTTSTPVTTTSIPVTSTEIQLTTTTSTITTNTTTNNTQQCQEGYHWEEAANGPLIFRPAGCQLDQPDFGEVKVVGCQVLDGMDPSVCYTAGAMDIAQIVDPCYGTNSLILRNKADPYRSTYPAKLKHNDCQGYGRIESSKADFALVEKFIVGSEQRFIETLKKAPQLVIDFNNEELRNKLKETNGRVPYTLVEAYVFGDLMNELANPDTRTPESNAALRWLAKGDQAVNLRTWANAQKMYNDWKHDPCAFKLPADFPQDFKDDFNRRNKDRALYTGCDYEDTLVASMQSVYSITDVAQGNPDVSEFVKWGGYLTTKDVLLDRQDSFNETALSLAQISVISAAAVATAGGIVAFIAAASIGTTVAFGGGVVASLAAVSAIFPFSGGIVAAASAGGAATTGAIIGVGALAGPLVIVVIAIVVITAAIGITATDRDFHNTMQSATPPWNIEFVMEKKIEEMRNKVSAGKGGELLFVFSDATNRRNSTKFLPITLVVPPKEKVTATTDPATWVLGTTKVGGGYEIFKRNGVTWDKVPGGATQITVDEYANPWVVNDVGEIYHRQNGLWVEMPGRAIDIGSGGGKTWVIGTAKVGESYEIYEWLNNAWQKFPGGAVRIDVGHDGNPWVVNSMGQIYHMQNRKWVEMPGRAIDIGSGGGKTWVIGTAKVGGGYEIYEWLNNAWQKFPGGAVRIDVGHDGNPWVVNSTGEIFHMQNRKWVVQSGRAVDIGLR